MLVEMIIEVVHSHITDIHTRSKKLVHFLIIVGEASIGWYKDVSLTHACMGFLAKPRDFHGDTLPISWSYIIYICLWTDIITSMAMGSNANLTALHNYI